MLHLFLVTFLFVSANCCIPTTIIPDLGRIVLCNAVIKPFTASSNSTITSCINEQSGLMGTIEGLRGPESGWNAVLIAGLLESNGYATEATTLRKCFARQNGMLNADGTYNMNQLKANILSAIGSNESLANTKVGLQQCPAVVNFDVNTYVKCVISYCVKYVATG